MRPEAVLLIGPTGSGKTPLGDFLERSSTDRDFFHFDFGAQLRFIAQSDAPPKRFTTAEHSFIKDVIDRGLLLENEHFAIARKILELFLGKNEFDAARHRLVLNGLPRHVSQARQMEDLVHVSTIIFLECSEEEVLDRIRSNAGGDRTGRSDDSPEMVARKLGIFRSRTAPLLDYYSEKGSRVVKLGAGLPEESLCEQLPAWFRK